MKRSSILFCIRSVVVAGMISAITCAPPTAPTIAPELSPHGKLFATHLVEVLKSLRVITDTRIVTNRFLFASLMQDSIALGDGLVDFDALSVACSTGLAKKSVLQNGSSDGLRKALAVSTQSMPVTVPVDSLYGKIDTTAFDTIVIVRDSARCATVMLSTVELGTTWDAGYDSVFYTDRVADSVDTAESLVRIRMKYTASDTLVDLQQWSRYAQVWNLGFRVQTDKQAGLVTYRHAARVVSTIIFDTIQQNSTSSRVYHFSRRDTSGQWWNSILSSVVLTYADSITAGGVVTTHVAADSAGVVCNWNLNLVQPVTIRTVTTRPLRLERSVIDVRDLFNPVTDSLARVSFSQTDVWNGSDTTAYSVVGIDICSLFVRVKPGSGGGRAATSLCQRASSTYLFLLSKPLTTPWAQQSFTRMIRTDYPVNLLDIDNVQWVYNPSAPQPFVPWTGRSTTGVMSVKLTRPFSNTTTRSLTWVDSLGSYYSFSSVSAGLATFSIGMSKNNNRYSYVSTSSQATRSGSLEIAPNSQIMADTMLGFAVRTMSGTLDSLGNGLVTVKGVSEFAVTMRSDSCTVISASAAPVQQLPGFSWVSVGDSVFAVVNDTTLGVQLKYQCFLDKSGAIRGNCFRVGGISTVPYSASFFVDPLNAGSAKLNGALAETSVTNVFVELEIQLWQENKFKDSESTFDATTFR